MKSNASVRRWWYDERIQGVIFQIIAISAVGFVIYSAVANALNNLEARSITTGFGFLGEQAGFSIIKPWLIMTRPILLVALLWLAY